MDKICKVKDCNKKVTARGYCNAHYIKWQRYGDPEYSKYEKRGAECKADDCNKKVYAKGLCNTHWNRFHKRGSWKDEDLQNDSQLTIKERLEKNKIITAEGCHEWTKQRDKDGYGVISIKNRPVRVHRASYMTFVGEIPEGLKVLHKCDNPPCFNPDHLFLGTAKDNSEDMVRKGRGAIGVLNPRSKLTEEQVREIKHRFANGETPNGIFPDYPVSGKLLRNIRAGKTWKHVTI